jgi:hypothetical protein
MRIQRTIDQALPLGDSWEDRWSGPDNGLIASWEAGRTLGQSQPDLAARAREGQLVPLPWKGGLRKALDGPSKYGTHLYLAMWQGLRGDDLLIETKDDISVTCSSTKTTVIFTSDSGKYSVE